MITRPLHKPCLCNPHHETSRILVSTLPVRKQKLSNSREKAGIETQVSLAMKPESIWSPSSHCIPAQMVGPLFSSLGVGGSAWSLLSSPQFILEQEKWSCSLPMVRPELAGKKCKLCNVSSCLGRCVHS